MKLWLAKARRGEKVGLVPTDEDSDAAIRRLGDGELVSVEIIRPRSVSMHRRLFAILTSIGENQEPQRDPEDVLDELKILAGHYKSMILRDPRSGVLFEVRTPKSIAFGRLTHDEFMAIWPSLEKAGIERFGAEYWLEAAVA